MKYLTLRLLAATMVLIRAINSNNGEERERAVNRVTILHDEIAKFDPEVLRLATAVADKVQIGHTAF